MKDEKLHMRVSAELSEKFKISAKNEGLSQSDLFEKILTFYNENKKQRIETISTKLVKVLSDSITEIEAIRDYETINKDEEQFLKTIDYAYELLIRSTIVMQNPENTITTPSEIKDEGDPDTMYKYGFSNLGLIDEVIKQFNKQ